MSLLESAWEQIKREFERVEVARQTHHSAILDELNQLLRRLRHYEGELEWASALLDGTSKTVQATGIFRLEGSILRLIIERGLDLPADLVFPLSSADAFASAVATKDPVIALQTSREVGKELSSIDSNQRAHIVPITNDSRVVAVLFATADESTEASGLELIAGMGSLVLERSKNSSLNRFISPSPAVSTQQGREEGNARRASLPVWATLKTEERELHGRAQRFARVRVAEMLLAKPDAAEAGLEQHDIYLFLKGEIDSARDAYRAQFMRYPNMCDHLHIELVSVVAKRDEGNLGQIIPVSWFNFWNAGAECRSIRIAICLAATLSVSEAYGPPTRQVVGRRTSPLRSPVGAALIAVAKHQLEAGDAKGAIQFSEQAAKAVPMLQDYAAFLRSQAEYQLGDFEQGAESASQIFNYDPPSPLLGATAALAVRANLQKGNPRVALDLIRQYHDRIPQPQADLLLAQCFVAVGELLQAVEYYQRVYYEYPSAREATDAAEALTNLKQRLGDAYPPPTPSAMIRRAQKLFDARNPAAAKIELAAAASLLKGAERDVVRVRLGVADFLINNVREAFEYLSSLKIDDSEADAERLCYLVRCARKLDKHADVNSFLKQLEQQHATSLWRMDTLIAVADQGRVDNEPGIYLPLYRACAATFAEEKRSAWCHWQITFQSYRTDSDDANDLLQSHLQVYGDSDDSNDALYFLGRLAERKNDLPRARAFYDELITRFPNTYYALVARERLKDPGMSAAKPAEAVETFLRNITWAPRPEFPSFLPGRLAAMRLERAESLESAGLSDYAESELKFGAHREGEQQNVYAFELAKMAVARNAPDEAMRIIKRNAPGYLYMPLDQAPPSFWKLAFPIEYRPAIQQYSRNQSLDPYLVAALIRQESEFNARVISHANAYGLMQLLPGTGRELARHFGIRRLAAVQLLTPDRNIQLGTLYFRNLLNSYGGQTEIALASYNAGPGRANVWRTWGPFREQPEFIEAVPFHETRNYIQVVLRNADVYRRLYAGATPDIPAYHAKPAPKTVTKRHKKAHKRTT